MSNLIDSEGGLEMYDSYEGELKLVQADINQKLEEIAELTQQEPRKTAVRQAERALEEATELLDSMRIEKQNAPVSSKSAVNARFRNHSTDIDTLKRRLASLSSDRSALFGSRYTDDDGQGADPQLEQRQQLLSGTDRLNRSGGRIRDAHRVALETEDIGRNTLADLGRQREVIVHTHDTLGESEGYTDRATRTLRGMARRMATNRIITIAIITVLVILIVAVVVSKFR